jgi:hypothetical protein
MKIEQFWEEFLSLLKSQAGGKPSNYTWEELVSQSLRMILNDGPITPEDDLFEQLGLLGIDFKQLDQSPTTTTFLSANADRGRITVRGERWQITFPVRQCDGVWQLTTGKCEINPCEK